MGLSLPRDKQKKAVMVAIAASILAGAATMFIPVAILERITGVTGLSEIIPATAAPLGDKARALIAFGTGALTLAIMILWLFQREEADHSDLSFPSEKEENTEMIKGERFTAIKNRISNFNLPKMPWVKADNDIRDLADLPNVRAADQHPDAPPRHPLSVSTEMKRGEPSKADDKPTEAMPAFAEAVAEYQPIDAEPMPSEAELSHLMDKPSLAEPAAVQAQPQEPFEKTADEEIETPARGRALGEMIGQLEQSMKNRHEQLAQLELMSQQMKVALEKEAKAEVMDAEPAAPSIAKGHKAENEEHEQKRPVLEEVARDQAEQGEVDSALNAALETLQRMNAQSR